MRKLLIASILVISGVSYAQIPDYIPQNGLVGYWPFDGNANDLSINANHGTVYGATLINDRNGNPNSAYSLDGVDDYIEMAGINAYSFPKIDFTVSAWFYMKDTTGSSSSGLPNDNAPIVSMWTSGGYPGANEWTLNNSVPGNYCTLTVGDSNSYYAVSGTSTARNYIFSWNMITGVRKGDSLIIYFNGVRENGISVTNLTVADTNVRLLIGARETSFITSFNFFSDLNIDEVGIWKRALLPCEINDIYRSYLPDSTISVSTCKSYTSPSGKVFTSSNTYMDTIPNVAGCDSVITINLTINNSTSATLDESICDGDTYISPGSGQVLSTTGIYMDTINNSKGCDSVLTINLTVHDLPAPVITASGFDLEATASVTGTYQWYLDGFGIVGATSGSYTAVENGNYTVEITDSNDCTGISAGYEVTGVGINEVEQGKINIHPNPSNGIFTIQIELKASSSTEVKVKDGIGRMVFTSKDQAAGNHQIAVDISNQPAGVYYVEIMIGKEKVIRKIVKE